MLCLLALRILVKLIEGERNIFRHRFEQAHRLVVEEVPLGPVNGQRAIWTAAAQQGQCDGREQTMGRRASAPRGRGRIGEKIIAYDHAPLTVGDSAWPLPLRDIGTGTDHDAVDIAEGGTGDFNRDEALRSGSGIGDTDPGEPEAPKPGTRLADSSIYLLGRTAMHDCLIGFGNCGFEPGKHLYARGGIPALRNVADNSLKVVRAVDLDTAQAEFHRKNMAVLVKVLRLERPALVRYHFQHHRHVFTQMRRT